MVTKTIGVIYERKYYPVNEKGEVGLRIIVPTYHGIPVGVTIKVVAEAEYYRDGVWR